MPPSNPPRVSAPCDFPEKYFDKLPRFNGSLAIPINEHIESVWNYMDDYGDEFEDVYMAALKESLEVDPKVGLIDFPLDLYMVMIPLPKNS